MRISPPGFAIRILFPLAASLLCASAAAAKAPSLPSQVPVPTVFPSPAGNIPSRKLGDTPVPEPRPDVPGADNAKPAPAGDVEPPEKAPLPEENPADERPDRQSIPEKPPVPQANPEKPKPGDDESKAREDQRKQPADPRSNAPRTAVMPADEVACRKRLDALGVEFEERKPESDPSGCALPYPIAVKSLGKTIDISPDALMDCAMAEATARFAADIVSPAARAAYGAELKSVSQASAYVCRPRNGTTKLSEHAFGNALDIGRFTLTDGTGIDVQPAPDEKAAKFLAAVRKAACGPFKTVLGPGSDADHERHFHLDLAPRKHGGTFCQ